MSRTALRSILAVAGVLLAAVAVWTRTIPLDVSLWGDEAYTARQYVIHGPERIFRLESYLPNNHVFFSLLTWGTTRVTGTAEWALRLMSVLPALASIGLTAWWALRRFGAGVAATAGLLLVTSPLHIGLSVQARGYGLGFLAAAGMLWFGVKVDEDGDPWSWIWFGAFALIGIWTLPQLAFVYGGHLLAVALRRERLGWVFLHGAVVGLLSVGFYRTLLSNIVGQTGRVGSRGGDVVGWIDIVADPARLVFWPWLRAADVLSEPLVVAVFAVLIAAGIAALLIVERDAVSARHLTLPWLAIMAALFVLGSSTLDRYISFLVVPIALLIAVGLAGWMGRVRIPATAQVVVGLLAGALLVGHALDTARLWDIPFENYEEAVAVANAQGIERIVTNRTSGVVGLLWYDEDIEQLEATVDACGITEEFVLIDFPWRPEPETPPCLTQMAGERIVVSQRRQPDDEIVIWVVRSA